MPRSIELVEEKQTRRKLPRVMPVASIATATLAVMAPGVSGDTSAYAHEFKQQKKNHVVHHEAPHFRLSLLSPAVRLHGEDLSKPLLHVRPPEHHPVKQKPLTPAEKARKLLTPEMAAAEQKVHNCEERDHGWHVDEGLQDSSLSTAEKKVTYPGGEGMSVENWEEAGGEEFSTNEADATEAEQKYVDYKWQMRVMHEVPDQDGCWPGGY